MNGLGDKIPGLLLAGDIGGTKTDLALYTVEAGYRAPLQQGEFVSHEYPSLEAIIREFLTSTGQKVDAACFDVAGPVIDGGATTTNLPWHLSEADLRREFAWATVRVLNDLEATARAVPLLGPADIHTLSAGTAVTGGAIAVIAPGTGLGEAFLTWGGAPYESHASEGGHADFAPATADQVALLQYLHREFEHVSVERACSGIAVPNIYEFWRSRSDAPEDPEFAAALATAKDHTRLILTTAVEHPETSRLCNQTLETFIAVLGAEAGNLALKVLATGGVYVGGGIPTHILPALDKGGFLDAFRNKGRFHDLLANIPVHVITAQAAMIGAASCGLEMMAAAEEVAKHGSGGR